MKKSSFFRFIPSSFNISDHKPTVGQIGFHARSMQSRTQVWTHLYFCLNVVDENHTKLEYCGYVVLTDILINLSTNQQTRCFSLSCPLSPCLSMAHVKRRSKRCLCSIFIPYRSERIAFVQNPHSYCIYIYIYLCLLLIPIVYTRINQIYIN